MNLDQQGWSKGSTASRSRQGFTLIELLVVVAIIALLISILLPSLNRARTRAKDLVCRTQLRNLGIAFTMYTNEENGSIPLNYYLAYQGSQYSAGRRALDFPWPMLLEEYQGENDNIHVCPMMSSDLAPYPRHEFDSAWAYWEHAQKPGQDARLATSYQMKPDLGSTDQFKPPFGTRSITRPDFISRFFKYVEDGEIPLNTAIVNVLKEETNIYPVVTKASQIKRPSSTMLFADRYSWHTRRENGANHEVRQLVNTDGSAIQLAHIQQVDPPVFDTEYMLKAHWYRTKEGRELVDMSGATN